MKRLINFPLLILSFQVEELEDNKRKLISQMSELETTVKNAQRDTKKMQDIRDSLQSQLQVNQIAWVRSKIHITQW